MVMSFVVGNIFSNDPDLYSRAESSVRGLQ